MIPRTCSASIKTSSRLYNPTSLVFILRHQRREMKEKRFLRGHLALRQGQRPCTPRETTNIPCRLPSLQCDTSPVQEHRSLLSRWTPGEHTSRAQRFVRLLRCSLLNTGGLLRCLKINLYSNHLAHRNLPSLDDGSPTQVEILAVDLRFRRQTCTLHSHHKTLAAVLGLKGDGFGHPMHRQIASDPILLTTKVFHLCTLKCDQGIGVC